MQRQFRLICLEISRRERYLSVRHALQPHPRDSRGLRAYPMRPVKLKSARGIIGIERISGRTGILSTLEKQAGVANLAALASFAAASTIAP
jgi:hypothetical protein